MTAIQRVGVIGGVRIPFCRNNTGYAEIGNFGMSVKTLGALVERYGLHGVELGEVAFGAVIKHASDWNLAREATLSSGLAPTTPGITTARACGTGLDNAVYIANKIATGQIDAGIAGGSDTTSDVPYERGFFKDLIVPFRGIDRDNNLRADTTLEKLASLKLAFDRSSGHGTLSAGNSTPLSDGASAALLGSENWARQRGLPVQAWLTHAQTAAVDFVHGAGLLMAPTVAVARMLKQAGLSLQDFDYYEIHEAFAAQVLCTLRAWESADYCKKELGLDRALGAIDPAKLNVNGSSLALGHPFAATGARLVATLAKLLEQKGSGRGLISICTAGGMGVTAILER